MPGAMLMSGPPAGSGGEWWVEKGWAGLLGSMQTRILGDGNAAREHGNKGAWSGSHMTPHTSCLVQEIGTHEMGGARTPIDYL